MEATTQSYATHEFLQQNNSFLNFCYASRLLSTQEINEVHKKRVRFEQQTKSANRSTRKNAFLRYLAFEMNLMKLIEMRIKQVSQEDKAKCREYVIIYANFIMKIFLRACTLHFRDDVFWKSALDFAITYNVRIRELISRALRLNNQSPDLWLICAKWYAEFSGEPKIARTIIQRGIRACPANEILWANFLEMECYLSLPSAEEFADALDFEEDEKDIKEEQDEEMPDAIKDEKSESQANSSDEDISQENDSDEDMEAEDEDEGEGEEDASESDEIIADPIEADESNEDGLTPLEQNIFDGKDEAPTQSIQEAQNKVTRKIDLVGRPELLYAVPIVIVKEILANSLFKDNVSIRFKILEIVKRFPHTEDIQRDIVQNIVSNFSDDSSTLMKCITSHFSHDISLQALNDMIKRISNLSKFVHSQEIWDEFITWCLRSVKELENDSGKVKFLIQYVIAFIVKKCNREAFVSATVLKQVLAFLHDANRTDLAIKVTSEVMKQKHFSSDKDLVLFHLQNLLAEQKKKKALKFLEKLFNSTNSVLSEDAVWELGMRVVLAFEKEEANIEKLFKIGLKSIPSNDKIRKTFYRWMMLRSGSKGAAAARSFILSLNPVPCSTYIFLLEETENVEGVNSPAMEELFEKALLNHGATSPEIWVRKIKHLKLTNRASSIGVVRHRALNTLEDINAFEEMEFLEDLKENS